MKEKKKTHGIQLLLRAVVRDPDGKVISDTGDKPARSFLIQFLEFIYPMFYAPANRSATATDGTEDMIYNEWALIGAIFIVDATVNIDTHGIVVGTGDTAETNTDYSLETKIAHGTGAGQLVHGTTVIGAAGVVGANVDMIILRAFTNQSGSTIGVKEAGIYTKYSGNYHCIIRDVFPGTVDVPDVCSLTIYYTLRTTV